MVKIYSFLDVEKIRQSGKILAEVFEILKKEIQIGVSLKYLDDLAYKVIKEKGARPAFLGYRPGGAKNPYRASICASVNNVIVHGFPGNYKLQSGDVLKIDCGVKYKNFYSDAAFTAIVGKGTKEKENLIKATKDALDEAIKYAKPGSHLGNIGWAIERIAEKFGVKAVEELTGHGIGRDLHEDPTIYNYGEKGKGIELKTGMVLAIEPMFSSGSDRIIQLPDESWATSDGSLSAHFEHTVAIAEKGAVVLTSL